MSWRKERVKDREEKRITQERVNKYIKTYYLNTEKRGNKDKRIKQELKKELNGKRKISR